MFFNIGSKEPDFEIVLWSSWATSPRHLGNWLLFIQFLYMIILRGMGYFWLFIHLILICESLLHKKRTSLTIIQIKLRENEGKFQEHKCNVEILSCIYFYFHLCSYIHFMFNYKTWFIIQQSARHCIESLQHWLANRKILTLMGARLFDFLFPYFSHL